MPEETVKCPDCNGKGTFTYCDNMDNGFLDTRIHMLRDVTATCHKCKGTGKIKSKD